MGDESLRLPASIVDEMVSYCEANHPNEACGIIALDAGAGVRFFPMNNAAASPVRYALEPKEQLSVYSVLDDRGWGFAVFHSHTRTDAYPSPTDVRDAREDVPYVIVSLARDPASVRAFRIVKDDWLDDTGEIVEVPVVIER